MESVSMIVSGLAAPVLFALAALLQAWHSGRQYDLMRRRPAKSVRLEPSMLNLIKTKEAARVATAS